MNQVELKKAAHLAFIGQLLNAISALIVLIGCWTMAKSGSVDSFIGGGVFTILGGLLGIGAFVVYFIAALKFPAHVDAEDKMGAQLFMASACISLAAAVFFFLPTFAAILNILSTLSATAGFLLLCNSKHINAKVPFLILVGTAGLLLLNTIFSLASVGDIIFYLPVIIYGAACYAWKQIETSLE